MKPWLLLFLLGFLTACNPSALLEKLADAEKQKIAHEYIKRLKIGDLEALAAELTPELRTDQTLANLKSMRAILPAGEPTATHLIAYNSQHFPEESNYLVGYQFGIDGKWFVVNAGWREKTGEPRLITTLRVWALEQSLQETNAFTFKRATAMHYLFFAAAVAVPLFILLTLIVCIRTPIPKRKWLWIIFVLLGFVQFSLNWTTGAWSIQPLAFQLFGASAMAASMYAPWIIGFSLPVGAVVFWVKRQRWLAAARSAAQLPPLTPTTP
jgi:hypothetical protein